MDEEGPQEIFKNNLTHFLQSPPGVELSKTFIRLFKERRPLDADLLDAILGVGDIDKQKYQIFIYFTKGHQDCNIMADILHDSGQKAKAIELRSFNHSEAPWLYTDNIELTVKSARILRSGRTYHFDMGSKPRGLCLIYLMEPKLKKESLRWEHIFDQMYFDVIIYEKQSCQDMANELRMVAKKGIDGNAFLMMFLGHGHDEKVIATEMVNGKAKVKDEMCISEIVDIFSETKAKKLKLKPKIFIFNCCRVKSKGTTPISGVYISNMNVVLLNLDTIKRNWVNCNKSTYIFYACAEGEKAWFLPETGLSAFGQAFSHTIAQYAWYKDFAELGTLTHNRLEKEYGEKYIVKKDGTKFSLELRPEIRLNSVGSKLFFNPGLYDTSVSHSRSTSKVTPTKRRPTSPKLNQARSSKRLAK